MKKYLKEEEYNQIVKIGYLEDLKLLSKLKNTLRSQGIDAYVKGNELCISVEMDRNDPHYVDDIIKFAKSEFNKVANNSMDSYRMAESRLRKIVIESVKKALKENKIIK